LDFTETSYSKTKRRQALQFPLMPHLPVSSKGEPPFVLSQQSRLREKLAADCPISVVEPFESPAPNAMRAGSSYPVAMRLEAPEAIDFETAANSEATLRLQKSSQHLQLQAHADLKTIR